MSRLGTPGAGFGHLDGDLVFGHEPDIHHEGIQAPQPRLAENAGQDGRILDLFEGPPRSRRNRPTPDPSWPSRMTSMASRAIMGETGVSLVMANSRHMGHTPLAADGKKAGIDRSMPDPD
jgi:hypothetical protein